jgi:hypothetical protein
MTHKSILREIKHNTAKQTPSFLKVPRRKYYPKKTIIK